LGMTDEGGKRNFNGQMGGLESSKEGKLLFLNCAPKRPAKDKSQ